MLEIKMIIIKYKKFKFIVLKMWSKLLEIIIIMIKKILFVKSVVKFLLIFFLILYIYLFLFIVFLKIYVGVFEILFEVLFLKFCVF